MTTVTPVRVLYLEDSEADAEVVQALLDESGMVCTLTRVESPDEFAAALEADGFDLILSDHALPSYDGLSVLARARKRCPEVPFIFVYRYRSGEQALDFIAKIAESSTEYSVVGKVNVHPAHGTLETALENAGQRAMGEPLHVVHLLTLSGRLCGGAVVALGTAVLAGWAWDIAALKASCPNSRR